MQINCRVIPCCKQQCLLLLVEVYAGVHFLVRHMYKITTGEWLYCNRTKAKARLACKRSEHRNSRAVEGGCIYTTVSDSNRNTFTRAVFTSTVILTAALGIGSDVLNFSKLSTWFSTYVSLTLKRRARVDKMRRRVDKMRRRVDNMSTSCFARAARVYA